jgi:Flp pilus assembly pilin Flp
VEYALLIAVLALGLVSMLALFRNAVGGLATRTAVGVATRSAGGYGVKGVSISGGTSAGTVGHWPAPPEADSAAVEPDSSSATGGTDAASIDPAAP